ncbi:MAG: hypothetical protein HYV07_29180 [Deltaproteobacteria bacterium]|nr:hypothetical protein [Deltaproteobacteria bacterium]
MTGEGPEGSARTNAGSEEEILEGYWKQVEASPIDDAAHKRFVAYAVAKERYLFAIERYRAFGRSHPELLEVAQREEKKIVAQVTAKVLVSTPKKAPSPLESFGWPIMLIGSLLVAYPHWAALNSASGQYSRSLWLLLIPGFGLLVYGAILVQSSKRSRGA